jgi:hypothetical protein
MSQVLCSQRRLCNPVIHCRFQLIETTTQRTITGQCVWNDLRQTRADHPRLGAGEEPRHSPAQLGHLVTVRLGQAFNEAMQSQAPQPWDPHTGFVIGHRPGGELVWGQAQERRQQRPQLMIGEPLRQQPKSDQGAQRLIGRPGDKACTRGSVKRQAAARWPRTSMG